MQLESWYTQVGLPTKWVVVFQVAGNCNGRWHTDEGQRHERLAAEGWSTCISRECCLMTGK